MTTETQSQAAPIATPTQDELPRRFADFGTLGEALDYAARGSRGLNFHDARGTLTQPYAYAALRDDALAAARRLVAAGIKPQDRIALVAETSAEFAALFFGVVYAGAWPVPLPLPTSFGGRDSYIDQLRVQLASCDPSMLIYPPELASLAGDAAVQAGVTGIDWASFAEREAPAVDLPQAGWRSGRVSAIFQRLDPLSARRRHHPPRVAQQPRRAQSWHGSAGQRSLRIVAALVSRHGSGRLFPVAGRQSGIDRLPEDRGFRAAAARVAGPHQP